MNWRNVGLIFHRELLDQLRDRRTLFMVAILPMLLYPMLGIGMVQMTVLFTEQPRTVVILGAADLPPEPLLDENHFARNWFSIPSDADKLRVITDLKPPHDPSTDSKGMSSVEERELKAASAIRDALRDRQKIAVELEAAHREKASLQIASLEISLKAINVRMANLLDSSGIQVLILIPQNFAKNLAQRQAELARRESAITNPFDYPRPVIVRNSADEKSAIAFRRVDAIFTLWERSILKDQLRQSQLPESLTEPIRAAEIDLAEKEQVSANVWAKMLPALLVLMTLTGAFYPAVDLCAGEKERGTMETLLICPATRTEIVLGKFLTVLIFSSTTALLNLLSVGFTGKYMASLAVSGASSRLGDLTLPPVSTLVWVMIILIPLATLFSALCLSIATFAKSTKEGQYYLTPLLMVALGLTMFCLSPATEMQPFYSVMPVIGPGLLLKGLMKATGPGNEILVYAAPVLITSIGYSMLALWWAIEQFGSEDVLFREAERFDLRLWVKHLLRDKEPVPTFSEAGFCFLLILMLQFLSWRSFQSAMQNVPLADLGPFQLRMIMIQQIALIATPALMMGLILTTSLRRTFSLRWPGLGRLLCAALLPFALHPLTFELLYKLLWFFPPAPPAVVETMKQIRTSPISLVLLTMAITPAICEEIAFRGFLLAGFRRQGRVKLAVVLSSCAFGIIHMIPHQVFNATLLGLVLGAICVQNRSLLPGVTFHFVYNTLGLLHDRLGENQKLVEYLSSGMMGRLFFRWEDSSLRYQPVLLCLLAVLSVVILRQLLKPPSIRDIDADEQTSSDVRA